MDIETDIEQTFAAEVINARGTARRMTTAGYDSLTCDEVDSAIANLWEMGVDEGRSNAEIEAIIDKYVQLDDNGDAWPRSFASNVVPFGR